MAAQALAPTEARFEPDVEEEAMTIGAETFTR
ncbi:MAG: hypothetical protein QOE58_3059, partial [Actinomycetota bacterium]|nr:hypothetical protein [Actinomycetota bacterium]